MRLHVNYAKITSKRFLAYSGSTYRIRLRFYTTATELYEDRILSGIQPTGCLHIGNYFGAVRNWVNLQNSGQRVICAIADLHSMTLPYINAPACLFCNFQDARRLTDNTMLTVACLLGSGIKPGKSTLLLQSQVPEHAQLYWVLGCLTTLKRLGQLPQFKEKTGNFRGEIPFGLFVYPVLQAADILIYKATKVPVGKDQEQHLQLAGELAHKFNKIYGETFPIPKPIVCGDVFSKIRNLRDPTKKMSKSSPDENSRIELTDSPDVIRYRIKKALTDSTSAISYDPDGRPGVSNLIAIHAAITGLDTNQLCDQVSSLDTGKYKLLVADMLIQQLQPIRNEVNHLLRDKNYLTSVLNEGTKEATELASETWTTVCKKVGCHFRASNHNYV